MKPLLVDTDVLIECLRGRRRAIEWLKAEDAELLVSSITVAELWAGARSSEEVALEDFLSVFRVVPVGEETGKLGGLIRREHGPGSGMGLADALIAATAEAADAVLVTFNQKHFPAVSDLRVPWGR